MKIAHLLILVFSLGIFYSCEKDDIEPQKHKVVYYAYNLSQDKKPIAITFKRGGVVIASDDYRFQFETTEKKVGFFITCADKSQRLFGKIYVDDREVVSLGGQAYLDLEYIIE